jgi:catechol 2,3-dioxygenase-like lactoylglutathione lyase family enzyme
MMASKAMHAVLPAADLERAKAWYSEKLGLQPVEEDEVAGAYYETGGAEFLLYQTEFAGTNRATAASFFVDDFDETIEFLRGNGVTFEEVDFGEMGKTVDGVISTPDGSQKAAWFKDSEGNIIAVTKRED